MIIQLGYHQGLEVFICITELLISDFIRLLWLEKKVKVWGVDSFLKIYEIKTARVLFQNSIKSQRTF